MLVERDGRREGAQPVPALVPARVAACAVWLDGRGVRGGSERAQGRWEFGEAGGGVAGDEEEDEQDDGGADGKVD